MSTKKTQPKTASGSQSDRKSEKKYTGIGIINRKCYLGGKEYVFVKGKKYTIDSAEVWKKLTNPHNRVLEGI